MTILRIQTIRSDASGDGHFHSNRTGHKHEGIDLEASQGEEIFAPYDGTVTQRVKPYRATAGAKSALNGFDFSGANYNTRIFYAKALSVGSSYKKGDIIARAENVKKYYSSAMTNHIHVEVRNKKNELLDPTELLTELKKKV